MFMISRFTLVIAAAVLCVMAQMPDQVLAQQKQQVSYKVSAENNKITQQQNIEVEDFPNHIVRIFEVHSTFSNNAPSINGIRLMESWSRGVSDQTDGTGSSAQYSIFVLENGDKIFGRMTNVLQNNSGKVSLVSAGYITGGTGKFLGIQGVLRGATSLNFQTGMVEIQQDLEYSIGK